MVGIVVMLYGLIVILINAFKESILWGLASLFIPLVALVFVFMHWADNKKPFLIYIAGAVLLGIGAALSPGAMSQVQ